MTTDGIYVPSAFAPLPLKWCSPEMIQEKKMSFKSDVWMFGGSSLNALIF